MEALSSRATVTALEVVKETGLSKEVSVGGTLATSGSTVSSTDVEPRAIWRVDLVGGQAWKPAPVPCPLIYIYI